MDLDRIYWLGDESKAMSETLAISCNNWSNTFLKISFSVENTWGDSSASFKE
jgi:hypothetical protein